MFQPLNEQYTMLQKKTNYGTATDSKHCSNHMRNKHAKTILDIIDNLMLMLYLVKFYNKYECTIDQELAEAAAWVLGRCCVPLTR